MMDQRLRIILKEAIDDELGQPFYHTVKLKNSDMDYIELCRKVAKEGLIINDNGEVGNCIWFWANKHGYNPKPYAGLEFCIRATEENKEKYEMCIDSPNMWAYRSIPIEDLEVVAGPMIAIYKRGEIDTLLGAEDFNSASFLVNIIRHMDNPPYFDYMVIFEDIVKMFFGEETLVQLKELGNPYIRFERLFL